MQNLKSGRSYTADSTWQGIDIKETYEFNSCKNFPAQRIPIQRSNKKIVIKQPSGKDEQEKKEKKKNHKIAAYTQERQQTVTKYLIPIK